MEKKFKFSDKSTVSKVVYLTVIAILCVSAIVIGIVAANSRKKPNTDEPSIDGGNTDSGNTDDGSNDDGNNDGGNETPPSDSDNDNSKITYISPLNGTVMKSHSTTVPVFSNTMDEWRIHTGLDILCDNGAEVYATADGEVCEIYKDPMLGNTVVVSHTSGIKSYYSNLAADSITIKVGDKVKGGDLLANVGDTTVIELADEPHLHFEMKLNDVSVNPLDYLSEESKSASLGIVSGDNEEAEV